ncbi:Maf family nucleotide pyrophosphatase [uncultured Martelella sp.]|uniref:Maf family nucleotide pyrophosphatase n=1 Tax=uncultured Martelella sp. TaxID=392331 RepID=UPI0029C82E97|nr:Maf family nucleotide pyrophosphatase [uncultured Martelella sp.]
MKKAMNIPIILASTSPSRRALLTNARLSFSSMRPHVDERAVEAPFIKTGATPDFLAGLLSRAKALDVSKRAPGAFVIGGDQVMAFEGQPYSKPENRQEAHAHLKRLSGKTHYLMSAFAIARDGEILFEACETAALHMRVLEDAEIEAYLACISDETLCSSGVYQLEGPGVRLFDRIDGDFFTILGMPMLQLLAALRKLGALHD